ncbi:Capsule polysaccharide biosynthesis protein [Rhizobium sp. NFR03]|nr:Capsule polysaccharide biosynthesis protein [Rhizobium sp. NFR03]
MRPAADPRRTGKTGTIRQPVLTYAFHMQAWKREVLRRYFPERTFVFVPFFLNETQLRADWLDRIDLSTSPEIFVWSLNLPETVQAFARRNAIPVHVVEDGFIRSAVPHAGRTPPLSLIVDRQTAYFDSRTASDLEDLLLRYDFDGDPALMERAHQGMALLLSTGISKYNAPAREVALPYGPKRKRRVLALGQVDGDASIRFGCPRPVTNEDMVRQAVAENPDAEVIYKPHPDVLSGVRSSSADLSELARICTVLTDRIPMARAFETIDHVYTMTSLAGFEALLRRLPVTVLGLPFYAGWGLTDDRQTTARRQRRLTVEQVFAATYLLYPRYFEPRTGETTTFEAVIGDLRRPAAPAFSYRKPLSWQASGPYGVLGWRHALTPIVAAAVRRIATSEDADYYRHYPIDFFRERPERAFRTIGRLLYPFDERPGQQSDAPFRLLPEGQSPR